MKLFNKETSEIVMSARELSAEDLRAVGGGDKTVCTTHSVTTVKGNTSTTNTTTVCVSK